MTNKERRDVAAKWIKENLMKTEDAMYHVGLSNTGFYDFCSRNHIRPVIRGCYLRYDLTIGQMMDAERMKERKSRPRNEKDYDRRN